MCIDETQRPGQCLEGSQTSEVDDAYHLGTVVLLNHDTDTLQYHHQRFHSLVSFAVRPPRYVVFTANGGDTLRVGMCYLMGL